MNSRRATVCALATILVIMLISAMPLLQDARADPGNVTITVTDRSTGVGAPGVLVWIGYGAAGAYKPPGASAPVCGLTDASGKFNVAWSYGDTPPYGSWYMGFTKTGPVPAFLGVVCSAGFVSEPGWGGSSTSLAISGGNGALTVYLTKFTVYVRQQLTATTYKGLAGVPVRAGYGYMGGYPGTPMYAADDGGGNYHFWTNDQPIPGTAGVNLKVAFGALGTLMKENIPVPGFTHATLTISATWTTP